MPFTRFIPHYTQHIFEYSWNISIIRYHIPNLVIIAIFKMVKQRKNVFIFKSSVYKVLQSSITVIFKSIVSFVALSKSYKSLLCVLHVPVLHVLIACL